MYATISDLQSRLGDVYEAIYQGSGAAEDLADAQAEIDGRLSGRYRIPVTAEASLPLLKGWTLTLAEERCYSRAAGSAYAEKVKERVALVRKYLDEARNGSFTLPGAEEDSSGDSVTLVKTDSPQFTRENMEGY